MTSNKDIIEKLNEIALEANWGTVEKVDGVPKAVAVIQEAINEIKRLRNALTDIGNLYDYGGQQLKEETVFPKILKKCGVELDENV